MNGFTELLLSNMLISALLALVAFAVSRLWHNPQLTHVLWLIVLVKLVTPSFFRISIPNYVAVDATEISVPDNDMLEEPAAINILPVSGPSSDLPPLEEPQQVAVSETLVEKTSNEPQWSLKSWLPKTWPGRLMVVWSLGAGGLFLFGLRRHWRLTRVIAEASLADERLAAEAESVATVLGLKHCPTVLVTSIRVSPLVTFYQGKLVVLIPSQLIDELDQPQTRSVLAHELAHIRRRDHWVRAFELIVLLLYWWNPLAWWASRQMRQAEEECCDARVVGMFPESRSSYGHALLRTVEFLTEGPTVLPIAASTFGRFSFQRRIEMIMKQKVNQRISWSAGVFLLLLAVIVLPLAAQTADETKIDKETQVDTDVPVDDIAGILRKIAAVRKSNYEKIETWEGTSEFEDTWPTTIRRASDEDLDYKDWRSISGKFEFLMDNSLDSIFSSLSYKSKDSRVYSAGLTKNYGESSPHNQYTIMTPTEWISGLYLTSYPRHPTWAWTWRNPPFLPFPNSTMRVNVNSPGSRRNITQSSEIFDPRFLRYHQYRKAWEIFEIYAGIPLTGTPKGQKREPENTTIRSEYKNGVLTYRIQNKFRGGDNMPKLVVTLICPENTAFHPTDMWAQTESLDLKLSEKLHIEKWEYETISSVVVPKFYQYSNLKNDGETRFQIKSHIKTTALNQPISPEVFTLKQLQLQDGDEVNNALKEKHYRMLNGELVLLREYNTRELETK